MKTLLSIDINDARRLVDTVIQIATDDGGKPVSVAVVDACGDPLLGHRMDGASADSYLIAHAKAETAMRGRKDTVEIGHINGDEPDDWVPGPPTGLRDDLNRRAAANPRFVSWAGGVCIWSRQGDDVAALAVSGRDQLEDHALAKGAIARWMLGNMVHADD
jgi:uncharacterized protein GlcG (DUF336 family)